MKILDNFQSIFKHSPAKILRNATLFVLLQEMPEQSLESLYDFIRSIWIQQDSKIETSKNSADTSDSMEGFRVLQSFAGTLPADFNDKKELDEMREEKYARFN